MAGVGSADELAFQALDLVLELVHHQVDGDGSVVGGGAGADGVTVTRHRHLTYLPGHAGVVPALREADLRPFEDGGQPGQPGHLGLGQRPDIIRDRLLASEDEHVHLCTSFSAPERGSPLRRG